jgi:hypothetical protein
MAIKADKTKALEMFNNGDGGLGIAIFRSAHRREQTATAVR